MRDGGVIESATGADLLEAALQLADGPLNAGGIATHLVVPLAVVRGWLREDR